MNARNLIPGLELGSHGIQIPSNITPKLSKTALLDRGTLAGFCNNWQLSM